MSSSGGSTDGSQRNSLELDGGAQGQRGPPAEPPGVGGQVKLKRYNLEDNFHHDMEQYLSTGYLQIAERRAPIGSMSSMEVNVDMLEQMDLMDMSDHEAMDVFLHTGGDDNSAASPVTGPDMEPYTTEISLKVPTQAELRHKLSSLSPTCTDSQDTDGGEEEDDGEVEEQGGGGGHSGRSSGSSSSRRRPKEAGGQGRASKKPVGAPLGKN
ncbi:dystrobrevin binding protein 1b isoform X1 [Gadus morhua]|uniref:dystrobrevin binding protein 1b isoform X1 n=1 Tax=Gadus morhua TaxID=8049 RepID=UPI0011B669F4|nr:dysbindin-like isoform X1 [Gadus morhua]XP_030203472.1 dysbindin-like isoform X1 [Gadus morhua]